MRRCLMLATSLVAAGAVSATADDHPRERAALAAIDLGPRVPAYLRDKTVTQIEEGLAAAGYEVVPSTKVAPALSPALAACREGACLVDVGAALHTDALVTASITAKDESTIVVMRLFRGADATLLAEVHEVCDLCGDSEIAERVGVAASALRARATEARGHLEAVTITPTVTPVVPPPIVRRPAREEHGSIVPGIATGVAGVLAIGAGIYLIHLDGQGTCHAGDTPIYPAPGAEIRYDPNDPSHFVCRDSYSTQTLGLVATGVGAVALAAGTYLAIRSRHHGVSVEVAPAPGGASASVGWQW